MRNLSNLFILPKKNKKENNYFYKYGIIKTIRGEVNKIKHKNNNYLQLKNEFI